MNISHMARALVGEAHVQQQDAKTLELKDGQIVRGVVLQLLDGQEALVSVNGARIRAHLETPLQAGQAAWLQVQPNTADGPLILRALTSGNGLTPEDMIVRLLQQLALKDTPTNREIVRQANDLGIQLKPGDGKALSEFLTQSGRQTPAEASRWIQSALITVQRGLPLTPQTVNSVAQVLHGTPLPELLTNVRAQLTQLADGRAGLDSRMPEGARQLVVKLADAIGNWLTQASAGRSGQTANAAVQAEGSRTTAAEDGILPLPRQDGGRALASARSAAGEAASARPATGEAASVPGVQPPAVNIGGRGTVSVNGMGTSIPGSSVSPQYVPVDQAAADTVNGTTQSRNPGASVTSELPLSARDINVRTGDTASVQRPDGSAVPANQAAAHQTVNGSMLKHLLQALGFGHEHELMERFVLQHQPQLREGSSGHMTAASGLPLPAGEQGAQQGSMQGQQITYTDTVKSLLLQAAGLEQFPASLRETMQQAAQSITGQQLFMTADRAAPLSYITMFVPFLNEKGEQLASVHIQTRKGRRGQLDSDNCHLLFDLQLSQLGNMMVDVQVTERIVALRVYNDHPMMQILAEEGKHHIQQAFEELGYRLSHMKTMPMPETSEESGTVPGQGAESHAQLKRYASGSTYKGVDLRI